MSVSPVGGRDTKKRNAVTPLMLKLWRLVGLLGSEEIESKQYTFNVTYVYCKYLADLVCLFKHSSSEQREKNFAWDGGTIVSEYLYGDTLASKVQWIFPICI